MKYTVIIITFFLIAVSVTLFGIHLPKDADSEDVVMFSVSRGETFAEIGLRLEKEGIIKNRFFFNLYAVTSGKRKGLQAGTYSLSPSMSIIDITDKIHLGDVDSLRLTIIEGWRSEEIAEYLTEEIGLDGKSFLRLVSSDYKKDIDIFLDIPDGSGLEGFLFPDTYFIPHGSDEAYLLDLMISNLKSKIGDKEIREIKKNGRTFFEIMTMASIIEKEVRTSKDKKLVSGLLWKRMEIGMPLQVDATIIYLTGKRTTQVSVEETKIDSPYNTYTNKGLPPGPISNPGLDSILAAIYPEQSDYLFYLSKPNGETVFSKNFDEHIIAKNRYLR